MGASGKSDVKRRYPDAPLVGIATAVWQDDCVLLVQRKNEPSAGTWGLPGGLLDVGETLVQGAAREVAEETGLVISNPVFVENYEVIRPDSNGTIEHHFVIGMYAAIYQGGTAIAGDDAQNVAWANIDDLDSFGIKKHSIEMIFRSKDTLDAVE